jgi:hypothetical protein
MPDLTRINPDGLQIAKAAVQAYLNTQTVFGINLGTHVSDAELTAATTAAVQAYLDFLNAPSI